MGSSAGQLAFGDLCGMTSSRVGLHGERHNYNIEDAYSQAHKRIVSYPDPRTSVDVIPSSAVTYAGLGTRMTLNGAGIQT